jgi:hypothetical protein
VPSSSVKRALEVFDQPSRLRRLVKGEIPEDALSLIRIAAGDEATTSHWTERTGTSSQNLRDACVLYLRSLILAAGNDDYKLLLLPPDAKLETLKSHKRWLLMWLHPDRQTSSWQLGLFRRISDTGKNLEKKLSTASIADVTKPSPKSSSTNRPDVKRSGALIRANNRKRYWQVFMANATRRGGTPEEKQKKLLRQIILVLAALCAIVATAIAVTQLAMLNFAAG